MLQTEDTSRLNRLLGHLALDPDNQSILFDAAEAAFEAGENAQVRALLARLHDLGGSTGASLNLAGLAAIRAGEPVHAISAFATIQGPDPKDVSLRFNLAWAHALNEDYEEAVRLLDATVIMALPKAARLKVESLHHLGRLDDALAVADPDAAAGDPILAALLSAAALDAEQRDLARAFALHGAEQPSALASLGVLALDDGNQEEAAALFARALAHQPDNARAQLGQGLIALDRGRWVEAAQALDRAAQIFRIHVGSWVAAGWAHFAAGQVDQATASFEAGVATNPKFSEPYGGLAVLNIVSGRLSEGSEQMKLALRLDPASFGGRLAQIMMLEHQGDTKRAEALRERALQTVLDDRGLTLAGAIARVAQRKT